MEWHGPAVPSPPLPDLLKAFGGGFRQLSFWQEDKLPAFHGSKRGRECISARAVRFFARTTIYMRDDALVILQLFAAGVIGFLLLFFNEPVTDE